MNHFYTYLIVCRRRGWYYVGKGRGDRWEESYVKYSGKDYRLLVWNVSEEEAFAVEIAVIAVFRAFGLKLYNLTDGGEGPVGHCHTETSRSKMRLTHLRVQNLPHIKARNRESQLGCTLPLIHRLKLRQAHLGKPHSSSHRQATRESLAREDVKLKKRQSTTNWWQRLTEEGRKEFGKKVSEGRLRKRGGVSSNSTPQLETTL